MIAPANWVALRDYVRGRLVPFLFREGASAPAAVLKLRRAAQSGRSLAREEAALRTLRSTDDVVAVPIPEPLALRHHAGLEALLLSPLPDLLLYTPGAGAQVRFRP